MRAARRASSRQSRRATTGTDGRGSAQWVACVVAGFGIPFPHTLLTELLAMRDWFTFENLPLTLIILLIIMSWLSFFSVILFAE